jgi:hypothetical protein
MGNAVGAVLSVSGLLGILIGVVNALAFGV